MRQARGRLLGLLGGVSSAALLATATLAPAAQHDQETCDQLKREVAQLEGMGVRDNLAKGAAWGKANLRSAQLEQVKKLIEMDEHVAFRCPRPKPQPELQPAAAAAGQTKAKVLGKGVAKAQSAEAAKAGQEQAKARPKPKPKTASEGAGEAAAPAAAKPRPRPAAPKAQDSYAPPPVKLPGPAPVQ